jgi:flagellin
MAMTINTNVVSINSQRNLSLSGNSLATAMQRLSSGLRVNSAKDDAAGLAISERMNAQAKGLAVAARNANDGISLAQTAEGALGKVGDMLQRMRELAVQSSNATNSSTDRAALQAEVAQLTAEIDRVAKTSSFNGTRLLDGTFAGAVFQVGAAAGDNITVGGLTDASAAKLGAAKFVEATSTLATLNTTPADAALELASTTTITLTHTGVGGGTTTLTVGAASSATEKLGAALAAINAKTADTGIIGVLETVNGVQQLKFLSDKSDFAIALSGTNAWAGFGAVTATTTFATAQTGGVGAAKVDTQANAWKALKQIDDAIDKVNSARGTLGALQTRFEKTVENIDIMNENISAARGRIVDADFAAETANLSRTQILQQAGTAMVAQANQLPQNVLSLLR